MRPILEDLASLLRSARQLHRAGRLAEAEAAYRDVPASDPSHPDALHELGVLALRAGDAQRAYGLIGHAVRARPAFPEALSNLGVALEALGRPGDAAAAYREALRLKPDYAEARGNLGNALRALGQSDGAVECYRAAVALRPADPGPHLGLGVACQEQGKPTEAVAHFRRWAALQPGSPAAGSDLLFALLHDPEQTPESLSDAHRAWAGRFERPLLGIHAPHDNDRDPGRRLRVGYVSPDFREHPTARFAEPLLAGHDRACVEVYCYADVRRPDAVTARLRELVGAEGWRDVAGMTDKPLAELIRQDRIDVLVDLNGHMAANRLPLFARRPATVQVSYLYPHSTGLTSVGYRITDARADPPDRGGEQFNTERLLRLDGCAFAYRPTDDAPDVSGLPALADGSVTFGMLNRTAKVTPQAVQLWAKVLSAVPGSRLLVLAAGGEANAPVRRLFESHGVAPARLRLTPTGPRPQYLRLSHEVDVLLDPFPYAGMTTTCDFLWQGVPAVTLARGGSAGRAGASLLSAAGLPQCVADSEEQYVEAAASLAHDLPALAALRSSLRERMARSPLRDERGLARRMENAYRAMWRAWCATNDGDR